MDNHTLVGVVIAVVVLMFAGSLYESDIRARWERAQQRRRRRERTRDRDSD
jgi:hypothetical protein